MDKKKGSASSSSLSEKTRKRVIKELEKTDLHPVAPLVPREAISGNTRLKKPETPAENQKVEEEGWLARNKWTVLLVVCGIVLVGGGIYYFYIAPKKTQTVNVPPVPAQKVEEKKVDPPAVSAPKISASETKLEKAPEPVKHVRVIVEEENENPTETPKPSVQPSVQPAKKPAKKVPAVAAVNEPPKPSTASEPEKTYTKPLLDVTNDTEVIIE